MLFVGTFQINAAGPASQAIYLDNIKISNSRAGQYGGAIQSQSGNLFISNSIIETSTATSGGAIILVANYYVNSIQYYMNLTMTNTTVSKCSATNSGVALLKGNVTLIDCTFIDNSAPDASVFLVSPDSSDTTTPTMTITGGYLEDVLASANINVLIQNCIRSLSE